MTRIAPILIGLLLAGAAGAAVATWMAPDPGADTDGIKRELGLLNSRLDDLQRSRATPAVESEVDRLELANIENRLRRLEELRGAAAGSSAASVPDSSGDSPPGATSAPDAALDEKIKEMVAKQERERWETIGKRFSDMGAQRESSMLDQLAEKHGLSPYQRTRMEEVLARRRAAIGEFFGSMMGRSGSAPDFTKIREKMSDVQSETDEAAKQILNQEQYDAYKDIEAASRRGPPWMGGGGGSRDR